MGYTEFGKKISLSGVGEQQILFELPGGAFDMIAPSFRYTLTDAGIGGAETLFDAVTRIRIYEEGESQALFDLNAGQFKKAAKHWRPASVDEETVIFDPVPTTAVQTFAQVQLHMPTLVDANSRTYMEITLNPSNIFAGATGFVGVFTLQYEPGVVINSFGIETPTVKLETNHRIDLSYFNQTVTRIVVDDVVIAADVTNVKLESADGGRDIDLQHPIGPALQYNLQHDVVTTMANVMQGCDYTDLAAAHHTNRELQFDLTVPAQPTVMVYYIDQLTAATSGTAGDVSRGTAEVSTVKANTKQIAKDIVTQPAEGI